MHREAMDWVRRHAVPVTGPVLDIGGRNINGTVRGLFSGADPYVSLDIAPGDGVDIVADAATWVPDRAYEVVVCCEVFEHTSVWRDIVFTAHEALAPGGLVIITTAAPGRPEHSAVDGGLQLHPGEWYANIVPADLERVLDVANFVDIVVDVQRRPADVRAVARRKE